MNHPQLTRAEGGELVDSPWGNLRWYASASLGNSQTMTFGRVVLKAGQGNPVHRHPNCDEILHVISGRVAHTLGSEEILLQTGDTLSIPAGVWHNAKALGSEDAHMVICFSSPDRQTEFATA